MPIWSIRIIYYNIILCTAGYLQTYIGTQDFTVMWAYGHKCEALIFFFLLTYTILIYRNENDTYSRYSEYVHTYIVHEYMVGIHLTAVPNVKKQHDHNRLNFNPAVIIVYTIIITSGEIVVTHGNNNNNNNNNNNKRPDRL